MASRYLFIIAGPSCAGKTTLIREAAQRSLSIFGQSYCALAVDPPLLRQLLRSPRLGGAGLHQPIEVTAGGILTTQDFCNVRKLGLVPSMATFVHVDLSYPIKLATLQPESNFARALRGITEAAKTVNSPRSDLFFKFWYNLFDTQARGGAFDLANFTNIAINTVIAKKDDLAAAKTLRDRERLKAVGTSRSKSPIWNRVIKDLYESRNSASSLYRDHIEGWGEFLKWTEQQYSTEIISTTSDHANSCFRVKSSDDTISTTIQLKPAGAC